MSHPVDPALAHGGNGGEAATAGMAADVELREWVESLDYVYRTGGTERLHQVLRTLHRYAKAVERLPPGAQLRRSLSQASRFTANTPYVRHHPAGA